MNDAFELLSNTADGAFAVDRRQHIVFWNGAAKRLLGHDPRAVLGRPCFEVVRGVDDGGFPVCRHRCDTWARCAGGSLTPSREIRIRTARGKRRWISLTTVLLPARFRELSLLAHLFRDVSAHRDVERRYRALLCGWGGTGRGVRGSAEADGNGRSTGFDALSPRERDVLRLLVAGGSTAVIADRLSISPTTARNHVQHILAKLGVHSRLEAVALAMRDRRAGQLAEE